MQTGNTYQEGTKQTQAAMNRLISVAFGSEWTAVVFVFTNVHLLC